MARYFFHLCLVAIIIVAANAEEDSSEVGKRTIRGKAVSQMIVNIVAGMPASCIFDAGEHCKRHWKNSDAVISCARSYFKTNKESCSASK